jgi:hypothetical protein
MIAVFSKTQVELSEKSMEACDLRDALEERQRELEDRVNTVSFYLALLFYVIIIFFF